MERNVNRRRVLNGSFALRFSGLDPEKYKGNSACIKGLHGISFLLQHSVTLPQVAPDNTLWDSMELKHRELKKDGNWLP